MHIAEAGNITVDIPAQLSAVKLDLLLTSLAQAQTAKSRHRSNGWQLPATEEDVCATHQARCGHNFNHA